MKVLTSLLVISCIAIASVHSFKDGIIPSQMVTSNPLSRIVSGIPAAERQFPWQVLLRPIIGQLKSYCGGSILSSKWVLTAGHCTYGVSAIELNFGSTKMDSMPVSMVSMKWIQHEKYDPDSLNNDVSLIELPSELSFNDFIQPVQLLSRSQANSNFFNQKTFVAGFGYSSDSNQQVSKILMYTSVRVITNSECEGYYGNELVISSTMCARGFDGPIHNVCSGDSGGPMIMEDGKKYTQIGVISFVSFGGCTSGKPSGYARLSSFLDWIKDKSGIPIRD